MFGIATDARGQTCDAEELVRGQSAAQVGNARKRQYFCVACAGARHPVSLKVRRDTRARNYTKLAWFSHHGGGGGGGGAAAPETARHWQAKHILSRHVGRYYFTAARCTGCAAHTQIEDGAGATGRVELPERTPDGALYFFDAALLRGAPGHLAVTSVLEVWATHKTAPAKRQYCLDRGYVFGEFDADAVIDAHRRAPAGAAYELENLAVRCFECAACARAQEAAASRVEHGRAQAIAEDARREQRAADDREFYHGTSTGAETRILQIQADLHADLALWAFFDRTRAGSARCVPLQAYVEEGEAVMYIENAAGWRDIHKQHARTEALHRDAEVASGRLRLTKTVYEGGVSIKCICGKWVHTRRSLPACVDVYKERVNPACFERMARDGARQHDYFSDNPYIQLCGLCANRCIFCNEGILQTDACRYGSCYLCFQDVPGDIERMQARRRGEVSARIAVHEESIAQIHASGAFRAFVDPAVVTYAQCADAAREAVERSEIIRDESVGRKREAAEEAATEAAEEAAKEAEALQYQDRMVREGRQRRIWAEQAEARLQQCVDEAIQEAGRKQQRVLEQQHLRLQQSADRLLDEESRQQGRAATAVPKKANVRDLLKPRPQNNSLLDYFNKPG